ncbi:UNVERIFIED_CONTAM: hypothetical protein GTU68_005343 [Idotea baltica]|nr:hypothetical protein [Idotea baltica]
METYATALLYAIPFFSILLIVEIAYGYVVKDQKYKVFDTVSSLSSGFTNILKDTLGLGLVLVSYPFLLEHLAIFDLQATWLVWLIAFVVIDFAGYWNHRLSHKVNFFWNQHVIHHSSEEFNLACALRQPISNLLFAQFWYHTRHINKMGWLEYIIVTPSQHRVHHAINPEYIDKNLGQILCVWDRWFGTFQKELENVPPQYGVLKPASTWNPVLINFQHLFCLIKDAWHTKSYWDKLRIWFMPTGWRPSDVVAKHPIEIIEDVYNFKRYQTPASLALKAYVIFQLVCTLLLLLFMFYNFSNIEFANLFIFSTLLFLGVYGYTSHMDGAIFAVWIEVFRGIAGLVIIIYLGDWFGLDNFLPFGSKIVALYFIFTIFASIYFTYFEKSREPNIAA